MVCNDLYIFDLCIHYSLIIFLSIEKEARRLSTFFAAGVRDGYADNAYDSGERFVYIYTRVNPGGQYNTTTGEYTCEKTVVYSFTFSIHGYKIEDGPSHSKAIATLMKEGVLKGKVSVMNYNTESMHVTLSQSLVLQCNAGEKVWVESRSTNNNIYGYSNRNVFGGFLLFMN